MISAKSKINILFIDNSDVALEVLVDYFKKYSIEITNYKSYETALKKLDIKKSFDVIIANTLDSSQAWVNFIRLVKAYSKESSQVVVIGNGSIEDLLYSTEIEAKKYFTIPCDYSKVANFVDNMIDDMISSSQNTDKVTLQDGWVYSYTTKTLSKSDKNIKLTKNEVFFIEALIKNNNKIMTYEELKVYIYKTKNLKSDKLHAIRTLARNIRAKTKSKDILATLNRVGYKIKIKD